MEDQSRIELRSDTFTKPGKHMLEAMMIASVGDDVFGEDPTVNKLELECARLFGYPAALFCPSGTMTNQIAINVHTQPGDELICEEGSHIYYYEGGGIAKNSGCQPKLVKGDRGRISVAQLADLVNPDDVHRPKTSLISLENTCNRGGGSCYELSSLQEISDFCNQHHLKLHLDGARLMNAIVAKNHKASDYGQVFHSISLCLSKGLGAPVGSVLMGDVGFIKQSRRVRKVFGGGMRQAGFLAAAGLYALQYQVDRLEQDHVHAQLLESALKTLPWVSEVLTVETNIVIFSMETAQIAQKVLQELRNKNVFVYAMSATQIRMVTHLDVSESMVQQVCTALREIQI
jgi:threonine aldolase